MERSRAGLASTIVQDRFRVQLEQRVVEDPST